MSLSNELNDTVIGNRPTNSGIIPYETRSRDSTSCNNWFLFCSSSIISLDGSNDTPTLVLSSPETPNPIAY